MVFLPYLTTLFLFIFFCNIFEIIPVFQFPATARMAIPLFLALITWLMFLFMGMKRPGPLHFFKAATVPPGVPKALLPLVAFIEMLQLIIVRPFSLAVRLFANMLAGHLLLATFALLTDALIFHDGVKIGGSRRGRRSPSRRSRWTSPSPASRSWSRCCRRSSSPS